MAESQYYAPRIGYRKCACCGEEVPIDPFAHEIEQDTCRFNCWYVDKNDKTVFESMKLTSWDGWLPDRRQR